MLDRRAFFLGVLTLGVATQTEAHQTRTKKTGKTFSIDPKYLPQSVAYDPHYAAGTIVVDPPGRFLYLIESPGRARRYGVGVGRAGLEFSGSAIIGAKKEWPSWRPTDEMIAREPKKYAKYADGMPGGKGNPLGARALYLFKGGYDTFYRIHGTTEPWTIGTAVSNGCIRMVNEHVIDLYGRVPVGAKVVVLGDAGKVHASVL